MRFFAAAFSAHTRLCSHSEVYSECFSCLVVCLGAVAGSLECLECTFVRGLRAGAPFSQPLRCAALSGFLCSLFLPDVNRVYCYFLLICFVVFCCLRVFLGFPVAAVSAAYRSRFNGSGQLRCGCTSSPFCWLGCSAADCLLGSLFDWFSLLVLFVTGLGLWKWRKLP